MCGCVDVGKRDKEMANKFKSLFFLFLVSTPAFAGTQVVFEEFVAPELKATWVVVDDFPAREEEAKKFLKEASLHARDILDRLDPLNPAGEMAGLLSKQTPGTLSVSPDLAKILYTTQEVAKQLREPLAKKIKVDLEKNQVILKSADVIINIEPVLKGYLTDLMINDLLKAGFQNSFLELGGVFVARGEDFNGPWKIEVSDPTTEYAHHSFFYKAFNVAAAMVSADQGGPVLPASDIKTVTVFTKEGACKAQGLATAVYAMGLDNAKKFLEDSEIERAVLIDDGGKFHQFPENGK